jgi:hypothetical protein
MMSKNTIWSILCVFFLPKVSSSNTETQVKLNNKKIFNKITSPELADNSTEQRSQILALEAEFLDIIETKVLLLAIHIHLY